MDIDDNARIMIAGNGDRRLRIYKSASSNFNTGSLSQTLGEAND